MAGCCFVEWKEQFVSRERGNRVVHYFLKDISGESVLAVIGTERSLRHMFYVVAEEFLNAYGAEKSVHTGFRWRSRREVVNWLTSMLSKQHRQIDHSVSPNHDPLARFSVQQTMIPDHKGFHARNLKGHLSDIAWSGVAWMCGKQLKHFPAFSRNGITIMLQSFVFVMGEKENRYLAYVEDMYEDRKCQEKVKVRWFHFNREVRGVVSIRSPHPREVFITPYAQVISAECVDGPATILTHEHYEKCEAVLPHDLLGRIHFCFRQFKSNRLKPFELSKLQGYFDQPIFSCFSPDFFEDEEFCPGDDVKVGAKRARSARDNQTFAYEQSYQKVKYGLGRRINSHKPVEGHLRDASIYKENEKIEFLCQDSGIRGCWFRCTVVEVSRKQMKIQYDDLNDEDSCSKLEEWVPVFRLARPDKLGMRNPGRRTIRPVPSFDQTELALEVGAPVDAWWSDGWWEGVLTGFSSSDSESFQVYIPSENLFLDMDRKQLRVSRDWTGDKWVDIEANPDILMVIHTITNQDPKCSLSWAITKEANFDGSPVSWQAVPKDNVSEEGNHELPFTRSTDYCIEDRNGLGNEKQEMTELNAVNRGRSVDNSDDKDDARLAPSQADDDNLENSPCINDDADNDADNGSDENGGEDTIADPGIGIQTRETEPTELVALSIPCL